MYHVHLLNEEGSSGSCGNHHTWRAQFVCSAQFLGGGRDDGTKYSSVSGKKVSLQPIETNVHEISNWHCFLRSQSCNQAPDDVYHCILQIKLKLEQTKEDKIAAANRQQLLAFLNSSTGD